MEVTYGKYRDESIDSCKCFFCSIFSAFRDILVSEEHNVKKTAIQAVLWQLVMGALFTLSVILSFILIGIPFAIGFGIMWFVVPIIGIVKTLKEEDYNYPIVGGWYQ